MALLEARVPALILLDINLPGMNGYQMLNALRSGAATRDVPIVAVSADALPRDVEKGLARGFAAYLVKPIRVPEILAVIDDCLGIPAADAEADAG